MPERFGLAVDRPDDDRASADRLCGRDAAFQGVPEEGAAEASADRGGIDGQLAEQDAGDGIGRSSGPQLARQDRGRDRRRRQPVEADHADAFPDDHHPGETLDLIGKRVGAKPLVQGGLAAIEGREIMLGIQGLGRQDHPFDASPRASSHGALRESRSSMLAGAAATGASMAATNCR